MMLVVDAVCTGKQRPTDAEFDALARALDIKSVSRSSASSTNRMM